MIRQFCKGVENEMLTNEKKIGVIQEMFICHKCGNYLDGQVEPCNPARSFSVMSSSYHEHISAIM